MASSSILHYDVNQLKFIYTNDPGKITMSQLLMIYFRIGDACKDARDGSAGMKGLYSDNLHMILYNIFMSPESAQPTFTIPAVGTIPAEIISSLEKAKDWASKLEDKTFQNMGFDSTEPEYNLYTSSNNDFVYDCGRIHASGRQMNPLAYYTDSHSSTDALTPTKVAVAPTVNFDHVKLQHLGLTKHIPGGNDLITINDAVTPLTVPRLWESVANFKVCNVNFLVLPDSTNQVQRQIWWNPGQLAVFTTESIFKRIFQSISNPTKAIFFGRGITPYSPLNQQPIFVPTVANVNADASIKRAVSLAVLAKEMGDTFQAIMFHEGINQNVFNTGTYLSTCDKGTMFSCAQLELPSVYKQETTSKKTAITTGTYYINKGGDIVYNTTDVKNDINNLKMSIQLNIRDWGDFLSNKLMFCDKNSTMAGQAQLIAGKRLSNITIKAGTDKHGVCIFTDEEVCFFRIAFFRMLCYLKMLKILLENFTERMNLIADMIDEIENDPNIDITTKKTINKIIGSYVRDICCSKMLTHVFCLNKIHPHDIIRTYPFMTEAYTKTKSNYTDCLKADLQPNSLNLMGYISAACGQAGIAKITDVQTRLHAIQFTVDQGVHGFIFDYKVLYLKNFASQKIEDMIVGKSFISFVSNAGNEIHAKVINNLNAYQLEYLRLKNYLEDAATGVVYGVPTRGLPGWDETTEDFYGPMHPSSISTFHGGMMAPLEWGQDHGIEAGLRARETANRIAMIKRTRKNKPKNPNRVKITNVLRTRDNREEKRQEKREEIKEKMLSFKKEMDKFKERTTTKPSLKLLGRIFDQFGIINNDVNLTTWINMFNKNFKIKDKRYVSSKHFVENIRPAISLLGLNMNKTEYSTPMKENLYLRVIEELQHRTNAYPDDRGNMIENMLDFGPVNVSVDGTNMTHVMTNATDIGEFTEEAFNQLYNIVCSYLGTDDLYYYATISKHVISLFLCTNLKVGLSTNDPTGIALRNKIHAFLLNDFSDHGLFVPLHLVVLLTMLIKLPDPGPPIALMTSPLFAFLIKVFNDYNLSSDMLYGANTGTLFYSIETEVNGIILQEETLEPRAVGVSMYPDFQLTHLLDSILNVIDQFPDLNHELIDRILASGLSGNPHVVYAGLSGNPENLQEHSQPIYQRLLIPLLTGLTEENINIRLALIDATFKQIPGITLDSSEETNLQCIIRFVPLITEISDILLRIKTQGLVDDEIIIRVIQSILTGNPNVVYIGCKILLDRLITGITPENKERRLTLLGQAFQTDPAILFLTNPADPSTLIINEDSMLGIAHIGGNRSKRYKVRRPKRPSYKKRHKNRNKTLKK